ncbi:MAG: ATP-grasp domain-containing protein [Candidatus Omnitrophica bacterium]|nr:ATP-grasp domain-containing protein [Candidatus Omnitrophota bacterium]
MSNVLVTGAGSVIGQALIKSIRKSSLKCRIIAADYFSHAVGLYWADSQYLLPDILKKEVTEEEWISAVKKILIHENIDVVLIGLDFELDIFSRYKQRLEQETKAKIIVGDEASIRICQDKWLTAECLRERGLNYAPSCLPESIKPFISQNAFPYVVKPRRGFRSRNVFFVKNETELDHALLVCPNPVIQKEMGTIEKEYTCGSLILDGEVKSVISLRRDLKDGNTFRAICDDTCEDVNRYIVQAAKVLNLFGPANYQLRLTEQGPFIFEINPRFSGTTYMRTLLGVNEVVILLESVLEGKRRPMPVPQLGAVLRFFDELFVPLDCYRSNSELS